MSMKVKNPELVKTKCENFVTQKLKNETRTDLICTWDVSHIDWMQDLPCFKLRSHEVSRGQVHKCWMKLMEHIKCKNPLFLVKLKGCLRSAKVKLKNHTTRIQAWTDLIYSIDMLINPMTLSRSQRPKEL